MQVTYPRPADEDALADQVSALSHGSFVIIKGKLKHDERVKLGGIEILLEGLEVVGASLPDSPIDGHLVLVYLLTIQLKISVVVLQ